MSPWFYGLVAGLCAVGAECFYRANAGAPWGSPTMLPGILLALGVNWGIWGMVQTQPLVSMAVIFGFITASLRLTYTLISGDHVSPGAWVGFGLVSCASAAKWALR